MKKKLSFPLLFTTLACLFSQVLLAQGDNALSFDGVDDYVSVPNASGIISGASGMSMSCWVYATNPSPSYPNFDGIMGFRNESNFDFYLLHLNTTTIEGRFRNSSGVNYDVSAPGFQINTWQHLVLTYGGGQLKIYLNGTLAGSTSASGSFSVTTDALLLGKLVYQSTDFMLGGKLDEVGLWDRALTASEINCLYEYGQDASDSDLKVYYTFNEGSPGSNNSGITQLQDSKGNINGNLNGFGLSGTSSNFVVGAGQTTTVYENICKGDSVLFGGSYYSKAGLYHKVVGTVGTCDSFAQLKLDVDSVDVGVTQIGTYTLQANLSGALYQWIDCATRQDITGAGTQSFTPTVDGDYAVVVYDLNCIDTSECYTITGLGQSEKPLQLMNLFPNPNTGNFILQQGSNPDKGVLNIYNLAGHVLYSQEIGQANTKIESHLPTGIYMASFRRIDGKTFTQKLVINR